MNRSRSQTKNRPKTLTIKFKSMKTIQTQFKSYRECAWFTKMSDSGHSGFNGIPPAKQVHPNAWTLGPFNRTYASENSPVPTTIMNLQRRPPQADRGSKLSQL